MKRKRGAPKTAGDVEATAILLPEEQDKAEVESEDPAVADWHAFAQDHYELVEQLPLSIHRSFSLMRELDDLAQSNTARIVPATKAYIALRDSLAPKAKGHGRTPSGLDLLAHVSAVVEPPTATSPLGLPPADVLMSAPVSPSLGSAPVQSSIPDNPELPVSNSSPSDTFPHDTRRLLTLIATLASDAVRASSEKLGIANAVYHSVGNHLTALDTLIAQHRSTLPHPPTPTPPPSSPALAQSASSSSIKIRTRRQSLQGRVDDADGQEEDQQEGTIPPLRLTRTPTTIRIRNKPKPKEETRQRSVSMTKNVSNSSSTSKNGPTNNKLPRNPPPTPRKSSNAGAGGVNNRPPTNKNANKKTATDEVYCICGQGSFGEMIACDGEGCEREWFHLPCVGLKVAPEANKSWFCNDCAKAGIPAKKRRRR
ncbi:PHD-finger protein [Rhizoctonia solani 123E]|uniref:Chromatin modification-related protein n=1 Tax=Rhizoctonia solani 123E TaxID=1423351 RepID=A0A074SK44_9AGAM|nr:PHD-finger protein [Rhizoctonia solani 123E]